MPTWWCTWPSSSPAARARTTRAINVDGTLNAFRAAAAAGCQAVRLRVARWRPTASTPTTRSASTEDWPTRPAAHLFYAQEKAELEQLLARRPAEHPGLDLYLLRPPVVARPARDRRQGRAARPLLRSDARSAGLAACPCRCRSLVPACRCRSSTRTTSARRSCCASWAPVRRGLQHRGRRPPHRRRHRPCLRPEADAVPGLARHDGGPRASPAPVPALRRAVGRGAQPPGDHGHHQGQAELDWTPRTPLSSRCARPFADGASPPGARTSRRSSSTPTAAGSMPAPIKRGTACWRNVCLNRRRTPRRRPRPQARPPRRWERPADECRPPSA